MLLVRQALLIARLSRENAAKDEVIDRLRTRLQRIQSDVELIAACIPPEKRDLALSLVRDRHRIEDGHIIEEAEAG